MVALDQGRIVGYAHIFTANDEISPMVVENQLRQFIYDARTVTGNDAMQDHNIHAVYAIARGQAYQYLDTHYHVAPANDPIQLGQRCDWREVKIIRCMQEPAPNTYRIDGARPTTRITAPRPRATWRRSSRSRLARPTPPMI